MQKNRERTVEERGLCAKEVERSRREHGSNRLEQQRRRSFLSRFISNLGDPVIRILLIALGVNLLLALRGGDWIETVGIAVAVLLATLISTFSEHRSEAAFARLSESCDGVLCRVLRDGQVRELPMVELVVGDVVLLSAGEGVPADGILLSGEVRVDQAAITGESREIRKAFDASVRGDAAPSDPENPRMLLRGSTLTRGECRMRVERVGSFQCEVGCLIR